MSSDHDQNSVTNIIKDGRVMAVPLNDVAQFYNFAEVNQVSDEETNEKKGFAMPAEAEAEEELLEPISTPPTNYNSLTFFKWDEQQTNFLLNEYANLIGHVGRYQKFKTKKAMWQVIAKKMQKKFNVQISCCQVETRFKVICNRKKKGVFNSSNLISGEEDSTINSIKHIDRARNDKSKPKRFLKKTDVVLVIPGKNINTPDPFDEAPSPSMSPISLSPVPSPSPALSPSRSMSPIFQTSDYRNFSGSDKILQKMLEQTNHNFLKYFAIKERRDEEKLRERRRYNDEKLKILREMAYSLDLKYRRK